MKNNFQYKWSKLFAAKRFNSKDDFIKLDAMEQQELLDDAEDKKVVKGELCCDAFNKIKDEYKWMVYIDDNKEKVSCLPYIMTEDGDFKVNFCPSCGKSVRDYTFKREEE